MTDRETAKALFEGRTTQRFFSTKYKNEYVIWKKSNSSDSDRLNGSLLNSQNRVSIITRLSNNAVMLCNVGPKYAFGKGIKVLSLRKLPDGMYTLKFSEGTIKSGPKTKEGRIYYKVTFLDGETEEIPVDLIIPTQENWGTGKRTFGDVCEENSSQSSTESETSSESSSESDSDSKGKKKKSSHKHKKHHKHEHHHHHKHGKKNSRRQPNVIIIPIFLPQMINSPFY